MSDPSRPADNHLALWTAALTAASSARARLDASSPAAADVEQIIALSQQGIGLAARGVADADAAPRLARPDAAFSGTETILFVEDNDTILTLVTSALRRMGYDVLSATNGLDALTMYGTSAHDIQLLVTDVVMPKMSGRDLATRLSELRPSMRVLFASGYTDDLLVPLGLDHTSMHFIQKPYTPSALAARIRRVLDSPPGVSTE